MNIKAIIIGSILGIALHYAVVALGLLISDALDKLGVLIGDVLDKLSQKTGKSKE